MSNLRNQVEAFLDSHESAPGAWCMVRAFLLDVPCVDDAEMQMAYERSEGVNDTERNAMLRQLSPQQLQDLAADCLEISLEKIAEYEEQI